jgi:hypothetical protein
MPGAVTASDELRVDERLNELPADDARHSLVHGAQLAALTALIITNKENSTP